MKRINKLIIVAVLLISTITIVNSNDIVYGFEDIETNTEYTAPDYAVIEFVSRGVLYTAADPGSTGIIAVETKRISEHGSLLPYRLFQNNRLVGTMRVYKINGEGEYSYTIRPAYEELTVDNVDILCSYDIGNKCMVGIEQYTINLPDDAVLNNINPLVQEDTNGIGRDWCFLSVMGMVINLFENTEYDTADIASMYLNKAEVDKSDINSSGYISNSDNYNGNSKENIKSVLEYRGYRPYLTGSLKYSRAKTCVDSGGTAIIFFNRKYMHVTESGNFIDITADEEYGHLYDADLNSHSVVIQGYSPSEQSIIIADPSPLEPIPGPYSAVTNSLINYNGDFYIEPRDVTNIQGTDIYKVYYVDYALYYNANRYNQVRTDILGQISPQLSSYACMASIINKSEGLNKNTEDFARDILPSNIVDYIIETDNNIFKAATGVPLNQTIISKILGLRGYTISSNLSYSAMSINQMQEAIDLGMGLGITYNVYDTEGNHVNTHFVLVKSVNVADNSMIIMDPSNVGSYKLTYKNNEAIDASYYGHGYTMVPFSIYRYYLTNPNFS